MLRGVRLRRSLILASLALSSVAAGASAQTPPSQPDAKSMTADLDALRDRLINQLKGDLLQVNLVPDDEPKPDPLIMNRLRMMVSPRLTYDRLSQFEGLERKFGDVIFQTFGPFTGQKSTLEYAPVYRIADWGTFEFFPCRLDLTYEMDEPEGINLQDSEGGFWPRSGHQKFVLKIVMNFAAMNKLYTDGSVIWFYGSGKAAAVRVVLTATYLDKPPPDKDRSIEGKDRGLTFTLVNAAHLTDTVANFRRIMLACQPTDSGSEAKTTP
jgi:hypothetical protein